MSYTPRSIVSRLLDAAADRVVLRLDRTEDERAARLRTQVAELHAEVVRQGDRVLDRVVELEIRSRRDIVYAGDQQAGRESSEFAGQHFLGSHQFAGANETLRYSVQQAPTGGMALEFGVATGATLRCIVEERGSGAVFGFDSFDGLPEAWLSGLPAGSFTQDRLPDVPGADLVVGLFDDTLPGFLAEHPGPVDFVHVDSDLYSSAVTVLGLVGPRLRAGSVVHFDEFYNYPGWQVHELRAWTEFVEASGIKFQYLAHAYSDCQVSVRITSTAATSG